MGGGLCLATTMQAFMIFRRLPDVLPADRFLQVVKLVEILKWLLVMIGSALLVQYWKPAGILIGFAVTYTAYFWMIFKV